MSFLQRFSARFGRRCFRCAKTTKIYKTANIINNANDKDAIKIGAFTHIKGELLTFSNGGKIQIGDYCYIGEDTRIWSAMSISIGNRVLISHNVNIFDNITHPQNSRLRHEQFKEIITSGHPKSIDLKGKSVVINDDVLIGCMSIIHRGVTIEEGAIISAGSVVRKDIPAYVIVEGNPAEIIRVIPEDER